MSYLLPYLSHYNTWFTFLKTGHHHNQGSNLERDIPLPKSYSLYKHTNLKNSLSRHTTCARLILSNVISITLAATTLSFKAQRFNLDANT